MNKGRLTKDGRELVLSFTATSLEMGDVLYEQLADVLGQLTLLSRQEQEGGQANKPVHLDCYLVPAADEEVFRIFIDNWNTPTDDDGTPRHDTSPPTVEIVYKEACEDGTVGFDLWFASPSTAFWFGRKWERHLQEWHAYEASILPARTTGLRLKS